MVYKYGYNMGDECGYDINNYGYNMINKYANILKI
jgi:hypothetical protein